MERKNERSSNYTDGERDLLADLVRERPIINSRSNSTESVREKNEAWQYVTQAFNAKGTGCVRSADSLKKQYDNMKQKAKKHQSLERMYLGKTGGGPPQAFPEKPDTWVEKTIDNSAGTWDPLDVSFGGDVKDDPICEGIYNRPSEVKRNDLSPAIGANSLKRQYETEAKELDKKFKYHSEMAQAKINHLKEFHELEMSFLREEFGLRLQFYKELILMLGQNK